MAHFSKSSSRPEKAIKAKVQSPSKVASPRGPKISLQRFFDPGAGSAGNGNFRLILGFYVVKTDQTGLLNTYNLMDQGLGRISGPLSSGRLSLTRWLSFLTMMAHHSNP